MFHFTSVLHNELVDLKLNIKIIKKFKFKA